MPITNDEIQDIKEAMTSWNVRFDYRVWSAVGNWFNRPENVAINTWDSVLELGRNYMVGADKPMEQYIMGHRSPLTGWLRKAAQWAWEHPDETLFVDGSRLEWTFAREGDHVVIALPHHGYGGERHWITQEPFKSRILVNVD